MTTVKVTYIPLRCEFGNRICDGNYKSCPKFEEDVDDDDCLVCRWQCFGNDLCIYNRTVKNFEYEGEDAYGQFAFSVGRKQFNDTNCVIESLEVDGKRII